MLTGETEKNLRKATPRSPSWLYMVCVVTEGMNKRIIINKMGRQKHPS